VCGFNFEFQWSEEGFKWSTCSELSIDELRLGVHRAAQVIEQWHEQTEVGILLGMVKGMVPAVDRNFDLIAQELMLAFDQGKWLTT